MNKDGLYFEPNNHQVVHKKETYITLKEPYGKDDTDSKDLKATAWNFYTHITPMMINHFLSHLQH